MHLATRQCANSLPPQVPLALESLGNSMKSSSTTKPPVANGPLPSTKSKCLKSASKASNVGGTPEQATIRSSRSVKQRTRKLSECGESDSVSWADVAERHAMVSEEAACQV